MTYSPRLYGRIVKRLESRPETSLDQLSRELGVSRFTVERSIKKNRSCTFRQYRDEIRLQKAVALLADPSLRIRDVARLVGYGYSRNFSRFVRRLTSKNPGELRRHGN